MKFVKRLNVLSEALMCVYDDLELTVYDKTVLFFAVPYGEDPIYDFPVEMISELSAFLNIDDNLLKLVFKAPSFRDYFNEKYSEIIGVASNFYNYSIFDAVVKMFLAFKELDVISDNVDVKSIRSNIDCFQAILHYFEMINAISSTYECMQNNAFTFQFTMYDLPDFSPQSILNLLKVYVISSDKYQRLNEEIILLSTLILKNEIKCRLNALFLVVACQMLKYSPFIEGELHSICDEMYDNLLFVLKNGRVISYRFNTLYCDSDIIPEFRHRNNHTTRFQLIYGYANYDVYELRLDLSHEGQNFVHLNNTSPGKNDCCLFDEQEYLSVLNLYPEMEPFFISYGKRWALKERTNCDMDDRCLALYDQIISSHSHNCAFNVQYSEDSIQKFIEMMVLILPGHCSQPIDLYGEYARNCFHYDSIMRDMNIVWLALIQNDYNNANLLINQVAEKANQYNLVDNIEINCIDDLILVVYEAEKQIYQ